MEEQEKTNTDRFPPFQLQNQLPLQQNLSQTRTENTSNDQGTNPKKLKKAHWVFIVVIFLLILIFWGPASVLFALFIAGIVFMLFRYSRDKQSKLGKLLLVSTFSISLFVSHGTLFLRMVYLSINPDNYLESIKRDVSSQGFDGLGLLIIGLFIGATFFPLTVWLYLNSMSEIKRKSDKFVLIEIAYFVSFFALLAGTYFVPRILHAGKLP